MREHIAADEPFVREEIAVGDALERFVAEGQDYKVELIEDLIRNQGVHTVSLYTNGAFTDLCRGPHAPSTKRIKAFKLQSVAGAYWRGDWTKPMLTRVYGTAFFSAKDLGEYLERLERARANDHRKLGPQLGLFTFSERMAPGAGVSRAPRRHRGLQLAGDAQPGDGSRARIHRGQDHPSCTTGCCGDLGPLAEVPREHVRDRVRRTERWLAEADGTAPATPSCTASKSTRTATSRSATQSRGCCTAASRAARSTACCACVTSPRTTLSIFSHRGSDPTGGGRGAGVRVRDLRRYSRWMSSSSSRPAPTSGSAGRRAMGSQPAGAGSGPGEPAPGVRPERGRRRLLPDRRSTCT